MTLRIKRLTQAPNLSWSVWDSARPEAVVYAQLDREEWLKALAGGINATRPVVLAALHRAEAEVNDLNRQLGEL